MVGMKGLGGGKGPGPAAEGGPVSQLCVGSWGLPDLRVYSQAPGNSSQNCCGNWRVRPSP